MDGPGAEIRLLEASAQLERDGEDPICGEVILTGLWDGRPMSCQFLSEHSDDNILPSTQEPLRLRITDTMQNAVATINVGRPLSTDLQSDLFGHMFKASLLPLEERVHVSYAREDDTTKAVIANLLNVPPYKGSAIKAPFSSRDSIGEPARLRFTGGGWKITIDDLRPWVSHHLPYGEAPEEGSASRLWLNRYKALDQVQRTGGTLVTHGIRIERENGATFGLDRALKIIGRLETFLSFVFGRRTRPLHACGYDQHRSRKWKLLDVRPPLPVSSSPLFTRSWLPQVSPSTNWGDPAYSAVDLSSAFGGFMSVASEDPDTHVVLARAIGWYEAALASFGSPASVVLAQAGLELLAWRRITVEMKFSEKSRKNLDAADQLRLLLSGTGLPFDTPAELVELSKKRLSVPEAITQARNAIVHPVDNSGFTKAQEIEAQDLALWYFEMLLLRMIGYNGEYWHRLAKENRSVPWQ